MLKYVNGKIEAICSLIAGIFSYKHKVMTLKQVFIKNLKEFRKKEGLSQMKLAEYCNTAPSYRNWAEISIFGTDRENG